MKEKILRWKLKQKEHRSQSHKGNALGKEKILKNKKFWKIKKNERI